MSEFLAPEVTYKEAEHAVLGSVLLRGNLIEAMQSVLTPEDFEYFPHQMLFQTMMAMYVDSKPIEWASVLTELRRINALEVVGGEGYLMTLQTYGVTVDWRHYANIVKEAAGIRRLRDFHAEGLQRAQPGSGQSFLDLMNLTQAEMNDLTDGGSTEGDLTPTSAIVWDAIATIEEAANKTDAIIGVPSGLTDLDAATTGFVGGQMIVIAARPGYGKSTLGLDIARNAAMIHGTPTAFFSLEMSGKEILIRLMAADMRIDMGDLRAGNITDADWETISLRQAKIADAPLFIDDTANITMAEIKAKSRRMQNKHGLGLIVIDYLQLMGSSKAFMSREQEVSSISRQVKLLAKELGVPIIVMAQLNRGSESRQGGKPILSDLRESGAIEQDADIVVFIHREDKVDETSTRIGEADLIIAKQRNGPTMTIPVGFQGHYSRFTNLSRQPEPGFGEEVAY